jgi:hypothetical protein
VSYEVSYTVTKDKVLYFTQKIASDVHGVGIIPEHSRRRSG